MEFLRADDEVKIGQLVEQRRPAVLSHAPEDAEDEVGFLPFAGGEVNRLVDGFLLGSVAHTAGVEQHDVALLLRADDAVTPGTQHRRDRLAVAFVHLAPICFDVDPVHGLSAEAQRGGGGGRRVLSKPPGGRVNAGKGWRSRETPARSLRANPTSP